MKVRLEDLPDWDFDVGEVSAGVYRAVGQAQDGRTVERTGTDYDAVLVEAGRAARELAAMFQRPGFVEVGDPEALKIHAWIAQFNNPAAWPPATVPRPILVGRIIPGIDDTQRQLFASRVHEAMRTLVPPGGYLDHADLQHWYGRFYPHSASLLAFDDLFVEGETGGFVTPDRSTGIASIDWDGPTLACFFGKRLVSALGADAEDPATGRVWPFLGPP